MTVQEKIAKMVQEAANKKGIKLNETSTSIRVVESSVIKSNAKTGK